MKRYQFYIITIFTIILSLFIKMSFASEGNIYVNKERLVDLKAKAEEIREDISINPDNAESHYDLADVLSDIGDLSEALEECNVAIQLDKENPYYVLLRGIVYSRLGNIDNAIDDFNRVIEMDSKIQSAYVNLSIMYRYKKEYDKAIEYCNKALAIRNDASIYYHMGTIYVEMEEIEKSREMFNKTISMKGRDSIDGKLALQKLEELRALEPKPTGPTLGYEGYIPSIDEAVKIASPWLELIDEGKYVEGWETSAEYLRNTMNKERWEKSLAAVRSSLGKVISRKLKTKEYTKTLPGAPDGEYVIIQYETSFEKKQYTIETVIPMIDKDGKWRVSGYYIR